MRYKVIIKLNTKIIYDRTSTFRSRQHAEGFAETLCQSMGGTSWKVS